MADEVEEIDETVFPSDADVISQARADYCSDDIEIDDEPLTSRNGDGGTWVAAWVYVRDEDCEGDDE